MSNLKLNIYIFSVVLRFKYCWFGFFFKLIYIVHLGVWLDEPQILYYHFFFLQIRQRKTFEIITLFHVFYCRVMNFFIPCIDKVYMPGIWELIQAMKCEDNLHFKNIWWYCIIFLDTTDILRLKALYKIIQTSGNWHGKLWMART